MPKKNDLFGLSTREAREKDSGFHEIVRKRGLKDTIFTVASRLSRWNHMSDEDLIEYGKKHEFYGMQPNEAHAKDSAYYAIIVRRKLTNSVFTKSNTDYENMSDDDLRAVAKQKGWDQLSRSNAYRKSSKYFEELRNRGMLDEVLAPSKARKWRDMDIGELIIFAQENDLFGISSSQAKDQDCGFHEAVRQRGLIGTIFTTEYSPKEWYGMSDADMIKYAEEKGLAGLTRKEAEKLEPGFSDALLRRNLIDKILVREHNVWKNFTNEQIVEYGHEHGLVGLTHSEVEGIDSSYCTIVQRRGLSSQIYKRKQKGWAAMTDEEIIQYGKDNDLFGLPAKEVKSINSSYEEIVGRRKLRKVVFKAIVPKYGELTDEELINLSNERNLLDLGRTKTEKSRPRHFQELKNRGLLGIVFGAITEADREMILRAELRKNKGKRKVKIL